jgi:hypothetical protein
MGAGLQFLFVGQPEENDKPNADENGKDEQGKGKEKENDKGKEKEVESGEKEDISTSSGEAKKPARKREEEIALIKTTGVSYFHRHNVRSSFKIEHLQFRNTVFVIDSVKSNIYLSAFFTM